MKWFLKSVWHIIVFFWKKHRYFRRIVGIFAILYGIIAIVTPVLPGSWFVLVGLELIGLEILFWGRFKVWLSLSFKYLRGKGREIKFYHFKEVFVPALGFIFLNKALAFAPFAVSALK